MNPYYVGPQTISKNPANYMQGVQAIGQSYAQGAGDFEGTDAQQVAGAGSAALQGAASGMSIGGPVGAAVGAGVGLAANQIGRTVASNQFVKSADTSVNSFDNSGEVPSFNFDAQAQAQQQASRLGDIGAAPSMTDLAVSSVSPLGIASQLLTNRRGARDKQRQIQQGIMNQQDLFNTANTQYQKSLLQKQAYQDRLNNVYNIPMGYF